MKDHNSKQNKEGTETILPCETMKKMRNAGYFFAGKKKTAAVKVCMYAKRSICEKGECYKNQFYGIRSHRCLQMTPNIHYCNFRCKFCWRDMSITKEDLKEISDAPIEILDDCIAQQKVALNGFPGNPNAKQDKVKEAMSPAHVAISLSGEPTFYPHLSEFIQECHKRKMSTFLVTNGSNPNVLEKLEKENALPTQLYISLTSFDEDSHLLINRPKKSFWLEFQKSLEVMKKLTEAKKTRTVLRMTIARGMNLEKTTEQFAGIINKAKPNFVEVKSYMAIGAGRKEMTPAAMPTIEELRSFAKELAEKTGYLTTDEHKASRCILLCKDEWAQENRKIKFEI